jgi:hypothetical protein
MKIQMLCGLAEIPRYMSLQTSGLALSVYLFNDTGRTAAATPPPGERPCLIPHPLRTA